MRPSIDERAAQRERMEASGRDRYDALLRHLQAGREIPVRPQPKRSFALDIHPSAGKIVLAAIVVVIVWFGAIAVTDWIRYDRVDTWEGPDASVQSGLRLPGCPQIIFREDVYFPAWIRYDGKVYRWTDRGAPIGPNSVGVSYLESGYRLGDLELFLMISSLEGGEGDQIMLRQGESPVGAVFVVTDCT